MKKCDHYRILVTHGVESWLSEVTEGVIITLKLSYIYIYIYKINRLSLSAAGMNGQDPCSMGAGDGAWERSTDLQLSLSLNCSFASSVACFLSTAASQAASA